MGKKMLIDLLKIRDFDIPADAVFKQDGYEDSFKTIRELATFRYTCRKCEKAPCMHACPVEALSKNEDGIISRAIYKCIRCKSCVVICPFGTIMDDLFEVKHAGRQFIPVSDEKSMEDFASCFPDDVVQMVDGEENPDEHIHQLSNQVLIKEKPWK